MVSLGGRREGGGMARGATDCISVVEYITYAISTMFSFSCGAKAITGKKEFALCNCSKLKIIFMS